VQPWITNIQGSWVKLGGTLMNESISRAAGADHGQELAPEAMEEAFRAIGRRPRQRTTLYQPAGERGRAEAATRPRSPRVVGLLA
jgi:FO synthase